MAESQFACFDKIGDLVAAGAVAVAIAFVLAVPTLVQSMERKELYWHLSKVVIVHLHGVRV